MKSNEMSELAGLMMLEKVKSETGNERNLERWAKRCTTHFTKKITRMLFEEIEKE